MITRRHVPGNMLVKFEVCSFNCFGAVIDRSAAHRHTSNENSVSAIHSVLLAKMIMLDVSILLIIIVAVI